MVYGMIEKETGLLEINRVFGTISILRSIDIVGTHVVVGTHDAQEKRSRNTRRIIVGTHDAIRVISYHFHK